MLKTGLLEQSRQWNIEQAVQEQAVIVRRSHHWNQYLMVLLVFKIVTRNRFHENQYVYIYSLSSKSANL